MALLRADRKGEGRTVLTQDGAQKLVAGCTGLYEGVIESAADLELPRLSLFDPGSMLFCLDGGSLWIKNGTGAWQEVSV